MRRGQAALEFLTTYGWAFLVILVMIGALAYFGILSPDRFLPERCNVGPEFSCDEYRVVETTGDLEIRFTNNLGQTIQNINIVNASWPMESLNTAVDCTDISANSYRAGDPIPITCTFDNTLFPPQGAKMKFKVDITYIPQGKTFTKPLTAEVYTSLQ